MDLILVLRHGQISEIGTYPDLLSHKGAFAEFILTYLQSNTGSDDENIDECMYLVHTYLLTV